MPSVCPSVGRWPFDEKAICFCTEACLSTWLPTIFLVKPLGVPGAELCPPARSRPLWQEDLALGKDRTEFWNKKENTCHKMMPGIPPSFRSHPWGEIMTHRKALDVSLLLQKSPQEQVLTGQVNILRDRKSNKHMHKHSLVYQMHYWWWNSNSELSLSDKCRSKVIWCY